MFINAQQSESRHRKNSPRIPAKRISKGLLHRGNCGKNRCTSEHYLKICFRTGKSRENNDFKDCRQSQNVCGQKAINGDFNKHALKLEKAKNTNLSEEKNFYENLAFQVNHLNFSIYEKELRIQDAFIAKDFGSRVEKETNEYDVSRQKMIFLCRDCFDKEVELQKLEFKSNYPEVLPCLKL
jgi:hypothetical protein